MSSPVSVFHTYSNVGSKSGSSGSLSAKETALQRVERSKAEIEEELEAARVAAARTRSQIGAYMGALEASNFTLANPGGGAPLLEDAACTLVRGRCYGLIGRNGKGKSTMLRAFAARRVGDVPANVTVHYVSQEVNGQFLRVEDLTLSLSLLLFSSNVFQIDFYQRLLCLVMCILSPR